VPFKFNTSLRGEHNNFVYGVGFSPDGANLVSVGADKKVWLYDGKSGGEGAVGEGEHKGSIFSVSWAMDSKKFVTSSADQTVKIWDVEAGKVVQSWKMGESGSVSVPDHQVGVVWPAGRSDGLIISLDLAGALSYLVEGSQKPVKLVQGHQRISHPWPLVRRLVKARRYGPAALMVVYVAGMQSTVWAKKSMARHIPITSGITAAPEGKGRMYSVGWDDTLRTIDTSANTFTGGTIELAGQPKGLPRQARRSL
jgi:WD40 repeat protein